MSDEDRVKAEQLALHALDLVSDDGDWPSPAYEEGPQARRAAAMQDAITRLAKAVLLLTGRGGQ
jgi:hypothetical protein